MVASLIDCPPELVFNILGNLTDPADLLNVSLTCKTLHEYPEDNHIWAGYSGRFKFWTTKDLSISANPAWKLTIKRRFEQNKLIDATVRSLIENPEYGLMPRFKKIMDLGPEAKDRLLHHLNHTPDDADDVLARRYWARRLFGACQRQIAVDILGVCKPAEIRQFLENVDVGFESDSDIGSDNSLYKGQYLRPEVIMAVANMLIVKHEHASVEWVTSELDKLASEFKQTFGQWSTLPFSELLQFVTTFLEPTSSLIPTQWTEIRVKCINTSSARR
jgi:hypothetical protein